MKKQNLFFNRYMKLICHQKQERSFSFFGKQFFLCARCAGIYLTFFLGFFFFVFYHGFFLSFSFLRIFLIFLVSIVPLIIDGLSQLYEIRESNNILRFLTGSLFGLGLSMIFLFCFFRLLEIFIKFLE